MGRTVGVVSRGGGSRSATSTMMELAYITVIRKHMSNDESSKRKLIILYLLLVDLGKEYKKR